MHPYRLTALAAVATFAAACAQSTREVNTGNVGPEPRVTDTTAAAVSDTAFRTSTDTTMMRRDTSVASRDTSVMRRDTSMISRDTSMVSHDTSMMRRDTSTTRRPPGAYQQADTGASAGGHWQATLSAPAGATGTARVTGTAMVMSAGSNQTTANVTIEGATAGGTHPWHVHRGTCGSDKGIVGPPSAYTPIRVGQDGSGTASVTLPVAAPTSGDYMVNVHKSATEMGVIVACGPLTKGKGM